MMKMSKRNISQSFIHLPLIALSVLAITPLVVMVFNSVKSRVGIGSDPVGPPKEIIWSNFENAYKQSDFGRHAINSGILVAGTVVTVLVLGGLAAYSLSRIQPPGTGAVMFYMLAVSSFPVWLYLVPLFFIWRNLGLLNTYLGLIIIYSAINSPFSIFLLRSYLLKIPKEIEEAAIVDGASRIKVLVKVLVPIAWTGFLTVGLVVALAVWGEFQIALVMIQDSNLLPVTTAFYSFAENFGQDWTLTSAVGVMMVGPILVIFLIFQRRFTEGLTQGSIKG